MVGNIYFQIAAIFYIVLLTGVFFSKKRLENSSNNLLIDMIIVSLISLALDVVGMYFTITSNSFSILNGIIIKANLSLLIIFMYLIGLYFYTISFNKFERVSRDKEQLLNSLVKKSIPLLGLSVIILFILPVKTSIIHNVICSSGLGVIYLYILGGLTLFSFIYRYISRKNDVKKEQKKYMLILILLSFLTLIISILYKEFLIVNLMKVFIIFYIYFTISNPDLEIVSELKESRLKVEKANADKADTLLSISHEVRTPLNTIIGFGEALLEEDIKEDAKDEVKYIIKASNDLLKSVNNLVYNNNDIKKLKLIEEKYNINTIIKQVVKYANDKLKDSKVEFREKIDSKLPEELYGDSIRIKQIMLNLINNAINYTKEGYIELGVNGITRGNIYRLIITVEDTGSGISSDKINLIFDKYNNVSDNLTIDSDGTNLGITKRLAEVMNGRINVSSIEKEGTKFTIVLDQKFTQSPSKIEVDNTVLETKKEDNFDINGKKILIVDDDNMNLKVASRLLKNYKLDITEVSSGLECLNKINDRNKYDLIFLDDLMPGMSGVETLNRLRKKKDFETPVVVLTANAREGIKEEYLAKGFDDYIAKPIDRKELKRVLMKFLIKEK